MNAQVTVDPGVYVISGGKLEIQDRASFRGAGVGFYFADKEATFDFKDEAAVQLSAAEDGPLAGLLFFEASSAKAGRDFKISSDAVSELIGTIYLPRGNLKASAIDRVRFRLRARRWRSSAHPRHTQSSSPTESSWTA